MSDLIIPPKKVIKIIAVTIPQIIKYGDSIIPQILSNADKKASFSFLLEDDPFHPYFLMKLEETKSGNNTTDAITPPAASTATTAPKEKTIQATIPPSFTYKQPPDIGGLQLDVIHLTAQYAALYGREFLQAIAKQEMDSPLFYFMKPNQPYFRFFTGLLDQYRLALDPSNQLRRRLEQESQSLLNIKANLDNEAENARAIAERKKKEAIEAKKDETMDQYDWDEFTVLATVDFDDDETEITNIVEQPSEVPMIPRTLKTKKQGIVQISPITGQVVPIEEFGDHLRFEKIHPQYQKELENLKERRANANSSLANGDQMAHNLQLFATGGPKAPVEPIIWDGRKETIKETIAMAVDKVNEELEEQENERLIAELKKEPKIIGPVLEKKKERK